MKTLYDAIEDKGAFKQLVLDAVEDTMSKMTHAEIYQVITDWRNNQPVQNDE